MILQIAIEMMMRAPNSTSLRVINFLMYCGVPRSEIASLTSKSRLYHDMGIYGEIAEGFIEVLQEEYGVDMRNFYFSTYFPPEGCLNEIIEMIPFKKLRVKFRKKTKYFKEYQPITLEKLDETLLSGIWVN